MTPFEKLLNKIQIYPSMILDVGAGGFKGTITTDHLLKRFSSSTLVLCEIDKEKADVLKEKYKDAIVINDDFIRCKKLIQNDTNYSLICVDLDSRPEFEYLHSILFLCDKLLDSGGYTILFTLYDTNRGDLLTSNALFQDYMKDHAMSSYGSHIIEEDNLKEFFSKHGKFEYISREIKNELIQWVLLRKK
jgi:phospholipid N-methyltransferase